MEKTSVSARSSSLKELANLLFRILGNLSYIQAGFLLRSHLDDFVSGAFFLLDLLTATDVGGKLTTFQEAEDISEVDPRLKSTILRLCQLSREMRFASATDPATADFHKKLEELFELTAGFIPVLKDERANDCRINIGSRRMDGRSSATNRSEIPVHSA